VRAGGTGNPGAWNAGRLLGRRAGAAVFAGDAAKAVLASRLGQLLDGDRGAHLAAVAAVAGHCYPATARFDGGKGVATSIGHCLATFPVYAPVDVAVAVGARRLAGSRSPTLVAVVVPSAAWILAGLAWSRRRLPNPLAPPATPLLPLANALTVGVIAVRALHLHAVRPDDLEELR
jgi:acyl phosphate:glycerol-3-phosphate acyltransferase